MDRQLSSTTNILISEFEKVEIQTSDRKISVNPIISKVATWYENLRNAMDYRDEEVVLRAAIERILKRRFLLGGSGKKIAEPLIRELVWARYFPDESISESIIGKVEEKIDLYLKLRQQVILKSPVLSESVLNTWIYRLMSSDVEHILLPKRSKKEIMSNFMFQVLKSNVTILDDTEQTRDVQVFIAVHKSFAKDDIALLQYHLFKQIFGELTKENVDEVALSFLKGYKEIINQLNYPRKDKILNYVKDKTAVFFIFEDLLSLQEGGLRDLLKNENELRKFIFEICERRYGGIASKVRRAVLRSVIFILLTKAIFAIAIEGTFENLYYGKILWRSTLINIGIPPLLMAASSLLIKTPDKENSRRIFSYIQSILMTGEAKFKSSLIIKKNPDRMRPLQNVIFTVLWFSTFLLAFGMIFFVLTKLDFNFFSLFVFMFFLAIVSFFSYRINQSAQVYSIEKKKNITTSIVDFFFLPFVKVGRHLADGISQLNLFLFILDFAIETPFKGAFGFFEQWFLFLQSKREELE